MSEETGTANGGGNGHVEPGLTNEDAKLIAASFQGKCCPLGLIGLSMAGVAAPQTGLVGPLGQQMRGQSSGELVGCQGPTCMWFRIIKAPPEREGDAPKVLGGDCVVPMTMGAVASLPGHLGGVLQQLGKFRFTPT